MEHAHTQIDILEEKAWVYWPGARDSILTTWQLWWWKAVYGVWYINPLHLLLCEGMKIPSNETQERCRNPHPHSFSSHLCLILSQSCQKWELICSDKNNVSIWRHCNYFTKWYYNSYLLTVLMMVFIWTILTIDYTSMSK